MGANFIETDLKNILPFKKLDVTLEYILSAEKPPFRTFTEIQKEINWEASTKELAELLYKLEKDGYIRTDIPAGTKNYWSTFEGRFFMAETGGYLNQIQIDYNKRLNADRNENRKWSNDYWLVRGTWAAGIAGGLLFLMEIVKFFFPRC